MQWTSEKCQSHERISISRNFVGLAGLLWFGLYEWTKESFSNIWLRIALCPFLLGPLSDIPEVRLDREKLNWNFCFLLSRQEEKLKWTASWRNSMKVTIDGSKPSVWLWQLALCLWPVLIEKGKKQLLELPEHLDRFCNVLPVFGFNSAKYDPNLIKSYLVPILVNGRDIEPTVIEKANQVILFKFGDIQLLGITNFLGGATSLDSFLAAYKSLETKNSSVGMVWAPWQNAENRILPVRRLLQ